MLFHLRWDFVKALVTIVSIVVLVVGGAAGQSWD